MIPKLIFSLITIACINVISAPAAARYELDLIGTFRAPEADGRVHVADASDGKELQISVDGLKPALLFGGDYNTYIVWLISPDGAYRNAGEILLDSDHSSLSVACDLTQFQVVVTAEPHFMVRFPSRFVVLETRTDKGEFLSAASIPADIHYNYERDTLVGLKSANTEVRTDVHQALTAFRLAQRADAAELQPNEFEFVRQELDELLRRVEDKAPSQEVRVTAREVVRLASAVEAAVRRSEAPREAHGTVLTKRGAFIP